MASIENPLSKLALDYWYKVVVVAGFLVFVLCGTGVLTAYPAVPTGLIALGACFVGLGEWVNHPLQTTLMRNTNGFPSGVLTGHPRRNGVLGVSFVVLGVALIGTGVYRLL